jgi:hypothetical protein
VLKKKHPKKQPKNIIEISLEELQTIDDVREYKQKLKNIQEQLKQYSILHSDDSFLQKTKRKYCRLKVQFSKGRKRRNEQVRVG